MNKEVATMNKYILTIDQSTQGTKAMIFDKAGKLICRSDLAHKQIIDEKGWVEHNPVEIIKNTMNVVKAVVEKADIDKNEILGVGITNQRETAMVWDKVSGEPIYNAIVWQCSRGEAICKDIREAGHADLVQSHTGLQLSPYFSAAKIAWILQNVDGAKEKSQMGRLCCGTIDSWLVYKLTNGKSFKTDYSNASRTQMFNITELTWDREVCALFGINTVDLAEVCDSNAYYGETDFNGFLEKPIPIHGVLGDSHGALFGQGCLEQGMIKSTYGTGSSVMMNIGDKSIFSKKGLVTSLAWSISGKVNYVLEGNVNYTGAVIGWLQKDLQLITSERESKELAEAANPDDNAYFIPAFTGLGAPYWDSKATGIICGITRTTGKAEIVKAALDSIAYQITDIVNVMREESGIQIKEFKVDGGPTKNEYLMQFQSDMLNIPVHVPKDEELSGIGIAYMAGLALKLYEKEIIFASMERKKYIPLLADSERKRKYSGWKIAVGLVLSK